MPKLLQNSYLEDLQDRFTTLQNQENKYECINYMYDEENEYENQVVNENCRKVMSRWFNKIVTHCNFNRELSCIAMHLLDRFISTRHGRVVLYDTRYYQLASVCCLQLSTKMHEPRKLDMESLSILCRGHYHAHEIIRMEYTILSALKWQLCPPTPYTFLDLFLELLPPNSTCQERLREIVHEQISSSIQDYKYVTINPSLIAISSLLNALEYMQFPYHLQVSFVHTVYVTAGIDCTNHFVTNLKKYIILSTNARDETTATNCDSTVVNIVQNRDFITSRIVSPVCVGAYED